MYLTSTRMFHIPLDSVESMCSLHKERNTPTARFAVQRGQWIRVLDAFRNTLYS